MSLNNSWNFTIPDTSAWLNYTPYADGFGLSNGWQTWYSESGYNTQFGEAGQGDSYHITSLDGALVNFQFWGTSLYLYGTANTSYDVALDNISYTSLSASDDLLFQQDSLADGTHSVTLTAHPNSPDEQLGFHGAVVTMQINSGQQASPSPAFYDNSNITAITYEGVWSIGTDHQIPNTTSPAPFHNTTTAGSSASLNFTGTAIAVNGMTNWGNGIYHVTLDRHTYKYNGSTFWIVPNALLFFTAGLDPQTTHTIDVSRESDGQTLVLNSFSAFQYPIENHSNSSAPPSSSGSPSSPGSQSTNKHSHSDAGVIAGSVIAGVVVVALFISFIWWWLRHRRPESSPPVTPFVAQRQSGQGTGNVSTMAPLWLQDGLRRKGERTFSRRGEDFNPEASPVHVPNLATEGSGMNTGDSLRAGLRPEEASSQSASIPITYDASIPPNQSTNIERILQAIADGIAATRVPGHEMHDPSIPPPQYA